MGTLIVIMAILTYMPQYFIKFNKILRKMPSMNGPANYLCSISYKHTDTKYQSIGQDNYWDLFKMIEVSQIFLRQCISREKHVYTVFILYI